MRLLVCGSRDGFDDQRLRDVLWGIIWVRGDDDDVVIHGAARGVDTQADDFAEDFGLRTEAFPADWDNRPRHLAGPERNQRMLDEGRPDLVVAFKNGFDWTFRKGGTEDMVAKAKEAGVPTLVVQSA